LHLYVLSSIYTQIKKKSSKIGFFFTQLTEYLYFVIDIRAIYAVIVAALYKSAVFAAHKQNKFNAATLK